MSLEQECIVIGGGIAGSFCAYLLSQNDIRCTVFEKRLEIDEKVCGGFVPHKCITLLNRYGIAVEEIMDGCAVIRRNIVVHEQEQEVFTYPKNRFGLGVFRKSFDSFLLQKAKFAGAHIVIGKKVDAIACGDPEDAAVICATGAGHIPRFGSIQEPVRLGQVQSVGISEIITAQSGPAADTTFFIYPDKGKSDYFWVIPIGVNTWNIGFWTRKGTPMMKKTFYDWRETYIAAHFCGDQTMRKPKGALCGHYHNRREQVHFIGDCGGTNNPDTGEGIYFALKSAEETALKIIRDYRQRG